MRQTVCVCVCEGRKEEAVSAEKTIKPGKSHWPFALERKVSPRRSTLTGLPFEKVGRKLAALGPVASTQPIAVRMDSKKVLSCQKVCACARGRGHTAIPVYSG